MSGRHGLWPSRSNPYINNLELLTSVPQYSVSILSQWPAETDDVIIALMHQIHSVLQQRPA